MTLSPRSRRNLVGVHPDLVRIVTKAAELGARFHVTCGLRTPAEQERLVAAGKSKTMRSRHLTGHAVDLVAVEADGSISYAEDDMRVLDQAMQRAAADLGLSLEWGGSWQWQDTPHWQLPWKAFPAEPPAPAAAEPVPDIGPKEIAAGSRKWAMASWVQRGMLMLGGGGGLSLANLDLGQSAGAIEVLARTVKQYGIGALLLACGLVYLAMAAMKQWQVQDAAEGRYTPKEPT